MSIINANPCRQKAPTIWTVDSLNDFEWIKNPNNGDIAMLVSGGDTTFWVYQFPFDGETNELTAIAGACRGAWLMGTTIVNVKTFGAVGDGVTNDAVAIQSAIDFAESQGGGDVYFPAGEYLVTSTLVISSSGVRLLGTGSSEKWGQGIDDRPTIIRYNGTGMAIRLLPAGVSLQSFRMEAIQLDGTLCSGAVDGLYFDVEEDLKQIAYCTITSCTFSNFPRHQVYQPEAGVGSSCFGISFDDSNFHNRDKLIADDLVKFEGDTNSVSQINFYDCLHWCFTDGKWCVSALTNSTRFFGGTVATTLAANGIYGNGGLYISGTHIEGGSFGVENVGVRYAGANGAFISPSHLSLFGTGVQIGHPDFPSSPAAGAVMIGLISNNLLGTAKSVSSLTHVGTVATAIVANHGYVTGDTVTISGANQAPYNGTFIISFVDVNTFTYVMVSDPGANATGTITSTRGRRDIWILSGGSRRGTVIWGTGDSVSNIGIVNERALVDGEYELIRTSTQTNRLIVPPGTEDFPAIHSEIDLTSGFFFDSDGFPCLSVNGTEVLSAGISSITIAKGAAGGGAPTVFAGSGDPNSVVSGPPGSIFLRVADTVSGSALWTKESGLGSSGWMTGPRGPTRSVSTDGAIETSDYLLVVDSTAGNVLLTLPLASSCNGKIYKVKKIVAANTVTVQRQGSDLIDGATTAVLNSQYAVLEFISDGTNWWLG